MAFLTRSEKHAARTERRRQELLAAAGDGGNDDQAAMFIEISGGRYKEKLWGAYQRIENTDGALVVYRKLQPDGGMCVFAPKAVYVVLRSGKKGTEDLRWSITDAPGSSKSFAKNVARNVGCPTRLETPWKVKWTKESDFEEEAGLAATEIPIGFYPVTLETARSPTMGPYVVQEGPASGTSISAYTELDKSQERGLSPRAWITIRAGLEFRGSWNEVRTHVGEEGVATLKKMYSELQIELREKFKAFARFTRSDPMLLYAKDETLASASLSVPSPDIDVSAMEAAESVGRLDTSASGPEQKPKKRKVDPEHVKPGGTRDPFLMHVGKGNPEPQRDAARERSGFTRQAFESIAIAEDFKALKRGNESTRQRILAEAPSRPWHQQALKCGVDDSFSDDDIDDIWLWAIALSQDQSPPPIELNNLLGQLQHATLRAANERVRPALARVQSVWDCLPRDLTHRGAHCPQAALAMKISIRLLAEDFGTDEIGKLGSCHHVMATRPEKSRPVARLAFQAQLKYTPDTPIVACAGFGMLFASHLVADGHPVDDVLAEIRRRLGKGCLVAAAWLRLVSLFIGLAVHVGLVSHVSDLVSTAPDEQVSQSLKEFVAGLVIPTQPFAPPNVPESQPATTLETKPAPPATPEVGEVAATTATEREFSAQEFTKALDAVVSKLLAADGSTGDVLLGAEAASAQYQDLISNATDRQHLAPSERMAAALERLVQGSPDNLAVATWPFFRCAELLRSSATVATADGVAGIELESVEARKKRRDNLLRACKMYTMLVQRAGIPEEVKSAMILRRAQIYPSLDEIDKLDGRASEDRLAKVSADHKIVQTWLQGVSCKSFASANASFWKKTAFPTAADISPPGPSPAKDALRSEAGEQGTTSQPPPQPTRTPEGAPQTTNSSAAAAASLSSMRPAQLSAQSSRQQTQKISSATTLPAPATSSPSMPPARETQSSNVPNAIPVLSVKDLVRGIRPTPPWKLRARVTNKQGFKTNSPGFWAHFSEDDVSMQVFFFDANNAAARVHDPVVRVGTQIIMKVRSRNTYTRPAHKDYGEGWQMIVDGDAELIVIPYTLGDLPSRGYVEIFALIVDVSDLQTGKNGIAFRHLDLLDDTSDGLRTRWSVFGTNALKIQDKAHLPTCAVVRINSAAVAIWNGRKRLTNGEFVIYGARQTNEPGRVEELRSWYVKVQQGRRQGSIR